MLIQGFRYDYLYIHIQFRLIFVNIIISIQFLWGFKTIRARNACIDVDINNINEFRERGFKSDIIF